MPEWQAPCYVGTGCHCILRGSLVRALQDAQCFGYGLYVLSRLKTTPPKHPVTLRQASCSLHPCQRPYPPEHWALKKPCIYVQVYIYIYGLQQKPCIRGDARTLVQTSSGVPPLAMQLHGCRKLRSRASCNEAGRSGYRFKVAAHQRQQTSATGCRAYRVLGPGVLTVDL